MTNPPSNKLTRKHYTIAILCALDKELLAVRALFDEVHTELSTAQEDTNYYSLGRIGRHNAVTTCLPSGEYGTGPVAEVVLNMRRSFPRVEFCLLVGIGGGVPSPEHDIRLGDVVVSHPDRAYPAVIQHDMGKVLEGRFESTGRLQQPPPFLMKAISNLKSDPQMEPYPLQLFLEKIGRGRPAYQFPGQEADILFAASSLHAKADNDCRSCRDQIVRPPRSSDQPKIHYGPIASGNQVIKSAAHRDWLGAQHRVLCIEMEAAGVMNLIPCLVIRGICDYSDSHKNKCWQEYAAATAAAYARLLLSVLRDYMDPTECASCPCHEHEPIHPPPKEDLPAYNVNHDRVTRISSHVLSITSEHSALLQSLRPTQDANEILQKYLSFAKRGPKWNPWPRDRDSLQLFQHITQWMSKPNRCLLTICGAPGRSSSECPSAENFACYMIQFLRQTTDFPVLWAFSLAHEGDRSRAEAVKLLISQALEISKSISIGGLPLDSSPTQRQLLEVLSYVLSHLKDCFVIIETRDAVLAERFQTAFQEACQEAGPTIKVLLIAYSMPWKRPQGSMQCAVIPSIRLCGSRSGWDACWNRSRAQFS